MRYYFFLLMCINSREASSISEETFRKKKLSNIRKTLTIHEMLSNDLRPSNVSFNWINSLLDTRPQKEKGCSNTACMKSICERDSYCCYQSWDSLCREENSTIGKCSFSFLCDSSESDSVVNSTKCHANYPKDSSKCKSAKTSPSKNKHMNAHEIDPFPASRIAFSSCLKLDGSGTPSTYWRHVRNVKKPDLWIWLGDNVYADGTDMDKKRRAYNKARDSKSYIRYGPIADPKIPVTGIWDDHDYGSNNDGAEYDCKESTQKEFCIHFNIPKTDVRHPDYSGEKCKQSGIYSALRLPPPLPYDQNLIGIHVINLDTRIYRSNIRSSCFGEANILGQDQWNWLQNELFTVKSEIKIISTGIQALTPTNFNAEGGLGDLCAYTKKIEFHKSITALREGNKTGMGLRKPYDQWSEVPNERQRLLGWTQKSINSGMAKKIIFVSGGLHFGDILAKRMPTTSKWGKSQTLYEVVASGVGRERDNYWPNANRVRLRTCDDQGNQNFINECRFPVIVNGTEYNDCIYNPGDNYPWCYYRTSREGHVDDKHLNNWGYCIREDFEVVPRENQHVTGLSCGENYHQTCGLRYVYGSIDIDWKKGNITMSVISPMNENKSYNYTGDRATSSSISSSFVPEWER